MWSVSVSRASSQVASFLCSSTLLVLGQILLLSLIVLIMSSKDADGFSLPSAPARKYSYTPRKKDSTSSPSVAVDHFEFLRRHLMHTLPEEIPELEVEWFLQNIAPVVDPHDLSAIVSGLETTIEEGRWHWYPKDPKAMAGVEDDVYKHLEDISAAVIDVAKNIIQKPITSQFGCRPRHTGLTESQNGNYKSDGNQLLEETASAGPSNKSRFCSVDSVATWEFKKEDTPGIINQVSKVLAASWHVRLIQLGIQTESQTAVV